MHLPDDATLAAFRERLDPAAFGTPFSGSEATVVLEPRPSTPAGFADWVRHHVAACRDGQFPAGGRYSRVVLVQDRDGVLRVWHEDPCCEPAWVADRVHREVAVLSQPWVLGVVVDPPQPSWEGVDPATGAWEEFSQPRWLDTSGTVRWYAESRRPGVARVAAGEQCLEHDPATGAERVTATAALDPRRGPVAAFRRVLARHPDRTRHRLR